MRAFATQKGIFIHNYLVNFRFIHFKLGQNRGPHTFWLKNGTVDSNADGLVNMLHYEDAGSAAIAALLRGEPNR
jgi:hypothetical protein